MSKEASVQEVSAEPGAGRVSSEVYVERYGVQTKGESIGSSNRSGAGYVHGAVHMTGADPSEQPPIQVTVPELQKKKARRFAFIRSKQFWMVLALSQSLAISLTGTNTLTTLMFNEGTSIPSLQSELNYALLCLIYTSWTIYKYGFKKWAQLLLKDGWRYFILAFCDVQGNYFTVLAYRYTNILSAQLINFWAIAVVLVISLIFLKVRYNIFQYAGILICCGGLGILLASDHITGNGGPAGTSPLKGDLFALVGATAYGLSNVFEEFLVSKRPLYEVIGQLAFWAIPINGVQAAIFDRAAIKSAVWNGKVGGYLTGYTLILTYFYSAAPILYRMSSAAFFNIGNLTANFWGAAVGTSVFGIHIHWMYYIALVVILVGHGVYYGTQGVLGDAAKPWLGPDQEGGNDGLGTARRQLENPDAFV